ncbi:3'(2'),5'-bisphosphate nucleotidase [Pneumocystis carinii B80]|uniref:3'(2'),5'-bisphosphate nucleotidase n=1 Tax=Pneumocystis carinii (strain B80) TaxID=1408658 RepID=A0A0W4ZBJ6_PNEC8|nr:3'(2'),5'-bisphosphate nucleotidase [Pneumocystis carinii B80]KTW25769.1 3'(2'),5'-bisphosphate nucleotidase [Pneumocystis carinii B80]
MSQLDKQKNIAIQAVKRACHLATSIFIKQNDTNKVLLKRDCSPVTVADFGVQAIITGILKEVFPGEAVIGEETVDSMILQEEFLQEVWMEVKKIFKGYNDEKNLKNNNEKMIGKINSIQDLVELVRSSGNEEGINKKRYWVIDPIDGTKGFLRGGQYAICLALIENGEPSLGVLGCPNLHNYNIYEGHNVETGVIFYASKGEGAYQRILNENGEILIHTRNKENIQDARVCQSLAPGHSALEIHKRIMNTLGITSQPIEVDSQVKYAMLARGECDIYLRLPNHPDYHEKIWDHAAGALIVQEAGGIVTDAYGKTLDFSKGKRLSENYGIVAASKCLHAKVLEAVMSILKKQ